MIPDYLALSVVVLAAVAPSQVGQDRRKAAVEQARAAQLLKTTAVVKGRCVDGLTAKPLAGCTVTFSGRPSNSRQMATHGPVDWQNPEPVVTGADGLFEFRFVPPPPYQHSIGFSCEGRYPRTGRWGEFEPGQVDDLGDVPFYPGFFVRGKVVDQNGKPVPKISVAFRDLCLPLGMEPGELGTSGFRPGGQKKFGAKNASHSAANDTRYGSTKEDGTFVTRVPLPAGTWPIHVRSRGRTLVSPKTVTIPENGQMQPLVVTIEQQPSLSGRVVDENGQPVQGVYLETEQLRGGQMASGYSRGDGSFRIFRSDTVDPNAVGIEISDAKDCEPPAGPTKKYAWGTTGIVIVLKRALSFPLTVVEAGTSKPVTSFSIECYSEKATSSLYRDARLGGEHPGGEVTVDKVWRGKNVLRVIPKDNRYAVTELIRFTSTEKEPGPAKVEIAKLFPLKVVVRNQKNQPVPRHRVQLIRPGTRPLRPDGFVQNHRGGGQGWSSDPNFKFPLLLSEAHTDDLGQCVVFGLEGREDLILRLGEKPGTQLEHDVAVGRDNLRREVRVQTELRGTLVRLKTSLGDIDIELADAAAPRTVANFLRYVDGGLYENGRFHRAVRLDNQRRSDILIEVIQGGRSRSRQRDQRRQGFPAIALERTSVTGLKHLDGTISMARGGVDSATSDFFICIGPQPSLDFGGKRNADGQGFAAFGQVVAGMDIVRKIQKSKTKGRQADTKGENLDPAIPILSATRLKR